jgi:hypothetical protein
MELIDSPRFEDYEITYHGKNRWGFLGNGWSIRDYDGSDITWFWGLVDGKDTKEEYELDWKDSAEVSDSHQMVEKMRQDLIISPNSL